MSVNDQILDAIELLAKSSVERAGYDKTIQAQVISCQDKTIGKYKCKFQDAIFYAYTGNTDLSLPNGAYVYILVPGNDMSKDKTILGTVDKLGINYVSMAIGDQAYNIIGTNCISCDNNLYLDIDINDYKYDIYDLNSNGQPVSGKPAIVDVISLNQYIRQSSSLIIGMKVQTDIETSRQQKGHYGITFDLSFINDKGQNIIRSYTLDENNMIDNPYSLKYPIRQYAIYDIDGAHFNRVQKITIFNSDFPDSSGSSQNLIDLQDAEIFLSDLQLKGAVRMDEEELNGMSLSFFTPQGTLFMSNSDLPKTIQAVLKIKGQTVSANQNVEFYWGTEDVSITTAQYQYYNKNLGRGWKCINNYNEIKDADFDQNNDPLIQWLPMGDTYVISFNDVTAYDNKIKVAAIYDGNVITKQINIRNLLIDADFLTIESSAGTKFYYGVGETNLTCIVKDLNHQYNNLSYKWAWQDNGGPIEFLENNRTYDFVAVQNNQLSNLQVKKLYNFGIFKCTVYNNNVYLGTTSITLINSMQGQGSNPLIIINGTVLYKYNEKGISPTSQSLQHPQKIQALSFILYDDAGNQVTLINNGYLDSRATVKWYVPRNNTLLSIPNISPDNANDQTAQYDQYINQGTLTYEIANRYDVDKINNQIKLQVTYGGAVSIAQTNFTFIKQGNIGTNGTEYYVKIIPNTRMNNPPIIPMITRIGNNSYQLNYGYNNSADSITSLNGISSLDINDFLLAKLYKNDQQIIENLTIEWSVLRNRYANSEYDDSSFSIIEDDGTYRLTYTDKLSSGNMANPYADIIQCAITYEDRIYYGTIPFITAYIPSSGTSKLILKQGSGFYYVMYAPDGTRPEYSDYDFEFLQGDIASTTGTCVILGNVKYKNGSSYSFDNNAIGLTQNSNNQFDIRPKASYSGDCVNNNVRYKVGDAVINIPVHLYLNRYGFAHLNEWNGNSIFINQNQGYILSPQVGAGEKDQNNAFTGVLMGEVKHPMDNTSKIGLFGYNKGAQTFSLDSKTGDVKVVGSITATTGYIGSTTSNNNRWTIGGDGSRAWIYSGQHSNLNDATIGTPDSNHEGIYIGTNGISVNQKIINNGTTSYEQTFKVDNNGNISVKGNITATSLNLGTNRISSNNIDKTLVDDVSISIKENGAVSATSILKWEQNKSYSVDNYVNDNGVYYKCKQYHTSSSYNRPPNNTYWEEGIPSSTFLVSSNGLLTANNAIIDGTIYSSAGQIGGWTISNNSLSNGTIGQDNSVFLTPSGVQNSVSIGGSSNITNWGITLGSKFGVTRTGDLYANNATISGNFTLSPSSTINFTNNPISLTDLNTNVSNAATNASTALTTANTANATAGAAESAASTAQQIAVAIAEGSYAGTTIKVNGEYVTYTGTFINGQSIFSPIIYSNALIATPYTSDTAVNDYGMSGSFILQDSAGNQRLTILYTPNTDSEPHIQFSADIGRFYFDQYVEMHSGFTAGSSSSITGSLMFYGTGNLNMSSLNGSIILKYGYGWGPYGNWPDNPTTGQIYFSTTDS